MSLRHGASVALAIACVMMPCSYVYCPLSVHKNRGCCFDAGFVHIQLYDYVKQSDCKTFVVSDMRRMCQEAIDCVSVATWKCAVTGVRKIYDPGSIQSFHILCVSDIASTDTLECSTN